MRELMISRKQGSQTDDLKREVFRLQKDLLQEKTKVKALSEELENPMNVHRWRKLEGSDPATYEMIQKIQTLQKRLIMKTEEVVEKDLLIQEKEKLMLSSKIFWRGSQVPKSRSNWCVPAQLEGKDKANESHGVGLNMHQAQVNEHR